MTTRPYKSAKECFLWIGLIWISGLPMAAVWANQLGKAGADEVDAQLSAIYKQYQQESASLKKQDRPKFFSYWDQQFSQVLSATKGGGSVRLRILDELGAIQKRNGEVLKSAATYKEMEKYAQTINDTQSLMIAANNELGHSAAMSQDDFDRMVETLETTAERMVNSRDDVTTRSNLSDVLVRIGSKMEERAIKANQPEIREKLLKRAARSFDRSISLGDDGSTPLASRMFRAAQVQANLGNHAQASEIYGKIATMDQNVMSKLYMAFLKINESTKKNTPEYRKAIEHVLEDFEKSGASDEYHITLRHELGLSYRAAKEYGKSSRILMSLVGKSEDADLNAYNLLLVAENTKDAGEYEAARDLYREVEKKYPGSGSASLAANALKVLVDVETDTGQGAKSMNPASRKVWLLIANAVFISVVVFFVARRRLKTAANNIPEGT